MKIHILNLILAGMLVCNHQNLKGQTRFNFPVDGAVFQQNTSEQHTIRLGGQVRHNDNKWYIRIRKRNGDDSWQDINIEQREISLFSVGDGNNT
ncbi:MAG: hypothetical protein LRY55_00110 [Leadbetterella sp.]|nr:hypothetical protein [Leadbetterella sp.]